MNRATQIALAKIDGFDVFSISKLPDYNDEGEMLRMLERARDKNDWSLMIVSGGTGSDWGVYINKLDKSPLIFERAPTFIEAATEALLKAGEK